VSQATAATVAFYENFSADFLVIAGGVAEVLEMVGEVVLEVIKN
jgi:hypothetical protein